MSWSFFGSWSRGFSRPFSPEGSTPVCFPEVHRGFEERDLCALCVSAVHRYHPVSTWYEPSRCTLPRAQYQWQIHTMIVTWHWGCHSYCNCINGHQICVLILCRNQNSFCSLVFPRQIDGIAEIIIDMNEFRPVASLPTIGDRLSQCVRARHHKVFADRACRQRSRTCHIQSWHIIIDRCYKTRWRFLVHRDINPIMRIEKNFTHKPHSTS